MSICSRCSNVSLATLRMAPCATEAKTAFRSSPKRVVRILAIPSVLSILYSPSCTDRIHTACYTGACQHPYRCALGDRDVETVDYLLEEERDLYIEQLASD